ncbi:MAG: phospholipid/cholesterol/gamma-HCH transport system substrate-binding protein [Mycobacterium sp.]|jgi:virulence factor Mce-like protein|nr:phospholipid/cholesterol/gamma-HCH transport system substrate-binding protein [Mycobacterium sp.]MDT5087395.1 phospholipid/cholesterol/gamma-HCH transport system substrate-binding protein [Mycobacterium sp.]
MPHNGLRALTGLVTVAVVAAIVAVAVGLFQGSFTESVPLTVLSPRAGLVMNADAKVKMHGVQVGRVASIESRPNGQAALHLAMDPSEMHLIPANVLVDLTSPTVFGAKFVELVPPAEPSAKSLHAGQVLDGQHVTVEINTVFKQLTAVLGTLDPAKLNETLGAVSQALSGRGEKIGQAFTDLDSFMAKFQPTLPALSHDIAMSAPVFRAYADASADLTKTLDNSVKISRTIVDEQRNLDTLLISAIGFSDVGNDVLGANRKGLTDVFHLLAPTTDLLNEYNAALTCTFKGDAVIAKGPVLPEPSIAISASLTWGAERYRYPANLPKVAATGGPRCMGLPNRPFNSTAKVLIADTGSNPVVYGNPQLLLNFDGLKQLLYGPIDGPPRNPAQVGQQG